MKIYVGNLPYSMNDTELRELFAGNGAVASAQVITDRFTGQSKGFGFVEMPDDAAAIRAIAELNDQNVGGRQLKVSEARPQVERPRREPRTSDARGDRGRW